MNPPPLDPTLEISLILDPSGFLSHISKKLEIPAGEKAVACLSVI
jgi:hypothetical protein